MCSRTYFDLLHSLYYEWLLCVYKNYPIRTMWYLAGFYENKNGL